MFAPWAVGGDRRARLLPSGTDIFPSRGQAYGCHNNSIDPNEGSIILEIFKQFADGMSHRAIAADLNARHVHQKRRKGEVSFVRPFDLRQMRCSLHRVG